ncbi:MAG: MBL fold metallo-hydrolase [Desulfobacteria bacterium]
MNNYLKFWGVRGSHPTTCPCNLKTGGNTACVELVIENRMFILDAGTGIISLGNRLISEGAPRRLAIFLSHYHWDHIHGLPFFVPAYVAGWEIDFFGPGGNEGSVEQVIRAQMSAPYFPADIEEWRSRTNMFELNDSSLTYENTRITPFPVHHPGHTLGYKIEWDGKAILYVPDNEIEYSHNNALFKNADILIHDSQYFPSEYEQKRGWGHSTYEATVRSAIAADVKNLFLFHHDPNHSDSQLEEMMNSVESLKEKEGGQVNCQLAVEGLTVEI